MIANIDISEGKINLGKIIASLPNNTYYWNEAQNRYQFIDRIINECLGWEKPYIEVEKRDEAGGIADYLLGSPVKAIIEAKREEKTFDIPPNSKVFFETKLRNIVENCKVFKSAYNQILSYCAQNGAGIAIVCNGPQMIIFKSYIQGKSPLDGECFVFNGVNSYLEHFYDLWKLISPEGMYTNTAFQILSEKHNPRLPTKASTALTNPKEYRYRTPFQDNLRAIASVLLDNIEGRPATKSEFYRECYVNVDSTNRNTLLSKNVISNRYKRVSDNGISPARINATIEDSKLYIDSNIFSINDGRPLVVIGDVGVGKTSFFENIFENLDADGNEELYYVHINLGEEAALSLNVKSHVLKKIPEIIRNKYGVNIESSDFVEKVYSNDLNHFDEGVQGRLKIIDEKEYELSKIKFLSDLLADKSTHIIRSLSYLYNVKKIQIIIVLDNGDQRTFETQQEAFLVAQELASSRKVFVFVALRPATFFASKLNGALSGYKNQVLTISPPPAEEVILKRISFAMRVAEGKIAPAALKGVTLNLNDIIFFLKSTLRSIKSNKDIRTFLSNITGGNTRLVIELFTSFCGSPNVEAERIVSIEKQTNNYKVPLHEFTKHALLGEYAYYSQTSSLVACNVYDIFQPDPKEHFLSCLLISYISSPTGERDKDGFVEGNSILKEMSRVGFVEKQIRPTLKRLSTHRLIETPHAHYREITVEEDVLPESFAFRATSVGIYHVRHWIGNFSFLDATSIDTPIFQKEAKDKVFSKVDSFSIHDRYERASAFRDYLLDVWHNSILSVEYFDYPEVLSGQLYSFESVEKYLKNHERK